MLNRFIYCKDAVLYTYRNTTNEVILANRIMERDFQYLNILKKIFKIFVEPSVELQGQVYTTINLAFLYIYDIYKSLKEISIEISKLRNKINDISIL